MARTALAPVTQWITEAALRHGPLELRAAVMQRLNISRRSANALLRRLGAAQWLVAEGSARRPLWRPGALRQVVKRYPLAGLQEDLPWKRDFAPCFELPAEVRRMAQHAFTELLNNSIDHSGGSTVTVSMRQTPMQLQLLVSDDGCGLFSRIEQSFAIADPQHAMLELSKGKLTSAPERHRGHGLFYTSRLADVFDIHANASAFQCRAWEGQRWRAARPAPGTGTSIYLAITLDTPRTLDTVLRQASADGAGYGLARTHVALALLADAGMLASRAEAQRVALRLQQFSSAELDFTGIQDIGHGFADELFRVLPRSQPGLELLPLAMAPRVSEMVRSIAA